MPGAGRRLREWVEQRPGLSRRAKALLLHGDRAGRYEGRNGAEGGYRMTMALAVACSQPGREWTPAQFHEALVLRPTAGGSWARAVRRLQGEAYLETKLGEMLAKARRFVGASEAITCRADALVQLAEIRAAVENRPWEWAGTAGGTDLKNVLARLSRAQRSGGPEHEASVRPLAEEAGCSRSGLEDSNDRLVKRGWLVKLPRTGASGRWLIRIPPETAPVECARPGQEAAAGARGAGTVPTAHGEVARFDSRVVAEVMREDAFHLWAHGASGARILACLDPVEGVDVAGLVRVLGLHRTTVNRRLAALVEDGLAVVADGLVYLPREFASAAGARPGAERLAEVAQARGTAGLGERRRARHAREREMYRRWVVERELRAEQNRRPDRPPLALVPEGVVDPATGELVDERWRGWDTSDPCRPVWRGDEGQAA